MVFYTNLYGSIEIITNVMKHVSTAYIGLCNWKHETRYKFFDQICAGSAAKTAKLKTYFFHDA